MLRALLVRHAVCDGTGTHLHGRMPGIRLSDDGVAQAQGLVRALREVAVAAVYTSPIERAVATAGIIAEAQGLPIRTNAAFTEIDFGDWTGRAIASLEGDAAWRDFNVLRCTTRIPGGDHMLDVQSRAVAGLLRLQQQHDGGTVVIVSHADVIRALLANLLGMPLDCMNRLDIAPATISEVELHGTWPRVLSTSARCVAV